MTKIDALNMAIENLIAIDAADNNIEPNAPEAIEVLRKMVAQLSKPRTPASDEAKARAAAKRKEKAKTERAAFLAETVPMVRDVMTEPLTAKEIAARLDGISPQQITYMISHNELGADVVTIPDGRNANKYMIKEGA